MMLTIDFKISKLYFKEPFVLAHGSRTYTTTLFTIASAGGKTGYGEAAIPPYLNLPDDVVSAVLKKINLNSFLLPDDLDAATNTLQNQDLPAPIQASVDMALHDLTAKLLNIHLYQLLNLPPAPLPPTAITIGINSPENIRKKVEKITGFGYIKLKLGGPDDIESIKALAETTSLPFAADANQGWKDKHQALDMIGFLEENHCVFIEQPMPVDRWDDMLWLKEQISLPVYADEQVQNLSDVARAAEVFDGINIKLAKCGSLGEAVKMARAAKGYKLKVLIGCMSESSCGVTAAAHLASLADWTDLDGSWLISNDPFSGISVKNGTVVLPKGVGSGAEFTGWKG